MSLGRVYLARTTDSGCTGFGGFGAEDAAAVAPASPASSSISCFFHSARLLLAYFFTAVVTRAS